MTPTLFTGSKTQKLCQIWLGPASRRPAPLISSLTMWSAARRTASRSGVYLPETANGEARAGEGLTHEDVARHAERLAGGAHFVLEQLAKRLDELQLHVLGQAADVVMALDHGSSDP